MPSNGQNEVVKDRYCSHVHLAHMAMTMALTVPMTVYEGNGDVIDNGNGNGNGCYDGKDNVNDRGDPCNLVSVDRH